MDKPLSDQQTINPDRIDLDIEGVDQPTPRRSLVARFNDAAAERTASVLSSMWLFWLIVGIFIVAFTVQPPKGAYEMTMFFMSAAFGALALPVLAFVSNIQGDRQEQLMNKMQDELMEELRIIRELADTNVEELRIAKELAGDQADN